MTQVAESKVTEVIKTLNVLEGDLDSLTGKVVDMKKQLSAKTQSEIDGLSEKTQEIATKEAEILINSSKNKATSESSKITQEGETKLSEIQSNIDTNFDEAVKQVVSIVLKA